MIRKYVCYIDVDSDNGEVNIEGIDQAPMIDYLSISRELLWKYEDMIREALWTV